MTVSKFPPGGFATRPKYTHEQKRAAALRTFRGESIAAVAAELGVPVHQIYFWRSNLSTPERYRHYQQMVRRAITAWKGRPPRVGHPGFPKRVQCLGYRMDSGGFPVGNCPTTFVTYSPEHRLCADCKGDE